jgi:hypothetical protein
MTTRVAMHKMIVFIVTVLAVGLVAPARAQVEVGSGGIVVLGGCGGTGTPCAIAQGGTGASTAPAALANLGGWQIPIFVATPPSGACSTNNQIYYLTTSVPYLEYICQGGTIVQTGGSGGGGGLPAGSYGQMLWYNSASTGAVFTPTAQESPVLPQSSGEIPRFTRPITSAGQTHLIGAGDSWITTVGEPSTWGILNNIATITGYTIDHNYGVGSKTACSINQQQVFANIAPTSTANDAFVIDGGIVDYNAWLVSFPFAPQYDLYQFVNPYASMTSLCDEANSAWLGTSLTSLQGTLPAPSGSWTADTTYGAFTGLKTSTSGATTTISITTTVTGQSIFLFYGVVQANSPTAVFDVTIDGTYQSSVPTTFPNAVTPAFLDTTAFVGVQIYKNPNLTAGTHTIGITVGSSLAGTDVVSMYAATMSPASITSATPQVWAMGIPYQINDQFSRITSHYNDVVKKAYYDVESAGVGVNFVDVRNCNFGTPAEMTDYLHASTTLGWTEAATCFIGSYPQTPLANYAPDNSWDNAFRIGQIASGANYIPMQLSYNDNYVDVTNAVTSGSNFVYLPQPQFITNQDLNVGSGKRLKLQNGNASTSFKLQCATAGPFTCQGNATGLRVPSGATAIVSNDQANGWTVESVEPGGGVHLLPVVSIAASGTIPDNAALINIAPGTPGNITLALPGSGCLLSDNFGDHIVLFNGGLFNVNFTVPGGGTANALTVYSGQIALLYNMQPGGTQCGFWWGETFSSNGSLVNSTLPIRDTTQQVLVNAMTASSGTVPLGSTGSGNSAFSWTVTGTNSYDLRCTLPVTFAASATIKFQLYSISGPVSISAVNSETSGNTGATSAFQSLPTIGGTSMTTGTTPVTGAPGANATITYDAQFVSSHAGNIGLQFIGDGTHTVTMLSLGKCGMTQIN